MPIARITKEDLKQRLDSGQPPVIVDARLKYPYEHSTVRLPGAVRFAGGLARGGERPGSGQDDRRSNAENDPQSGDENRRHDDVSG